MSITHNIENLTDKQKSDLELAKTLLTNINSLRPSQFVKTTLNYDNNKFKVVQSGFLHSFLIKDIHFAIKGNYENHKNFILDTFQKDVDDYNKGDKSPRDKEIFKVVLKLTLSYYVFNSDITYPLYSSYASFQNVLTNISNSLSIHNLVE
jgi:hypothetical protein